MTTVTGTGLWLRDYKWLHIGTQFTAPYEQGVLPFYRAADWAQVSGASLPIHAAAAALVAVAGVLFPISSVEGLGPGVLKVHMR